MREAERGPRPLLLVDVDGVIAPFGGDGSRDDRSTEGSFDRAGLRLRIVGDLRGRIARLEEAFECVWATGWEHHAPEVFGGAFGFGSSWPVIGFDDRNGGGPTWKLSYVAEWCDRSADGRRVAWVDDEFWWDAEEWARQRGDTLLVRTDAARGLTADQVEELVSWARGGR